MRRREFIFAVGGAAALTSYGASAQPASKTLRIGTAQILPRGRSQWRAFEQRLQELGFSEGRNLTIEYLTIASAPEAQMAAVKELLRRKVDIIVASGPEIGLKSALAATTTLPIVCIAIDYDPVALGYVKSLARPGGNVTGVVSLQVELSRKRLQVLKDAFPDRNAAVVFWDRISADQWQATQDAAATLGMRLYGAELRGLPYDYEAAFAKAPAAHRGTMITLGTPITFLDRSQLAALALKQRAVSMFFFREYVVSGGLLSYGPALTPMFVRAAEYVNRIARGAKPADLPIEQPTKFELVLNLKTAKAIGIELPPALIATADEVIE